MPRRNHLPALSGALLVALTVLAFPSRGARRDHAHRRPGGDRARDHGRARAAHGRYMAAAPAEPRIVGDRDVVRHAAGGLRVSEPRRQLRDPVLRQRVRRPTTRTRAPRCRRRAGAPTAATRTTSARCASTSTSRARPTACRWTSRSCRRSGRATTTTPSSPSSTRATGRRPARTCRRRTTSPSTTTADVAGMNAVGVAAVSAANAAGTTYNAASARISASTPITPGAHQHLPVDLRQQRQRARLGGVRRQPPDGLRREPVGELPRRRALRAAGIRAGRAARAARRAARARC